MAPRKKDQDSLDADVKKKIRQAYRSGKRKITIDGRDYTIARSNHEVTKIIGGQITAAGRNVNVKKGGEREVFKESWLIVKPTRPPCVPVWNIELEPGKLRSIR